MWRKTRKAINKIIEKKKKDIGAQKNNNFLISYRNWKNDPAEEPSKEFKKLLDEANAGHPYSQILVGIAYDEGNKEMKVSIDHRKAFGWYLKAATQGNAEGQYCVATMYEDGKGTTQNYQYAIEWYKKAANQGYAMAQTKLGLMYELGKGVEQSYVKALEWYKKAAEQNESNAQFYIASLYADGNGVDKNLKSAYKWYKKAARGGNMYAMYCLGMMYENGDGIHIDYEESLKWYKCAADAGYTGPNNK